MGRSRRIRGRELTRKRASCNATSYSAIRETGSGARGLRAGVGFRSGRAIQAPGTSVRRGRGNEVPRRRTPEDPAKATKIRPDKPRELLGTPEAARGEAVSLTSRRSLPRQNAGHLNARSLTGHRCPTTVPAPRHKACAWRFSLCIGGFLTRVCGPGGPRLPKAVDDTLCSRLQWDQQRCSYSPSSATTAWRTYLSCWCAAMYNDLQYHRIRRIGPHCPLGSCSSQDCVIHARGSTSELPAYPACCKKLVKSSPRTTSCGNVGGICGSGVSKRGAVNPDW